MKRNDINLLTLILLAGGCAILFLILLLPTIVDISFDRPSVLGVWGFGMLTVITGRVVSSNMAVYVPSGFAGVTYAHKEARNAVAGPTTLYRINPFRRMEVVPLEQKPLDLSLPCITKDRIQVTLVVSVYYSIRLDSMVAHLNRWIDVIGDIKRNTCFRLLQDYASCELANVSSFVPQAARRLTTFCNNPIHSHDHFDIQRILIIDIKYPIDIIRSAQELVRAQNELEIARTKAAARVLELTPEIDSRVNELHRLEAAIKTVSKATLDYVETHTVLDHLDKLPRN